VDVLEEIESFKKRSKIIPQKTRVQKIQLYSEGLKAKMKQAEFALDSIKSFEQQSDQSTSSTANNALSISEKIEFYCDAFWTFLYSSLDVLAQIINQALKLKLDEKHVSFKYVEKILCQKHSNLKIQKSFTACKKSNPYKNLDDYRNCSIHRRQIYIKEERKTVRHTAGYKTTTAALEENIQRTLCDNPLQLSPRTKQQRKIPDYMEDSKNKLFAHIAKILKETLRQNKE